MEDDNPHPPYPRDVVKQRLSYTTSLNRRYETQINIQREYEESEQGKLQLAKDLREAEQKKRDEAEREKLEALQKKAEQLAEQRKKMREEAEQWSALSNAWADEDDDGEGGGKKKKKSGGGDGKKKRSKKEQEEGETESDGEEKPAKKKKAAKKVRPPFPTSSSPLLTSHSPFLLHPPHSLSPRSAGQARQVKEKVQGGCRLGRRGRREAQDGRRREVRRGR